MKICGFNIFNTEGYKKEELLVVMEMYARGIHLA